MKVQKALKIVGICVLGMTLLLSLCIWFMHGGSDYKVYPDEKASTWTCDDPRIEIHFQNKVITEGYLEWNDEKIPIVIGMQSSAFNVYRSSSGQIELREEDILFRGYWHYEGTNMVVEIGNDSIFNGVYSELVFSPQ